MSSPPGRFLLVGAWAIKGEIVLCHFAIERRNRSATVPRQITIAIRHAHLCATNSRMPITWWY